MEPAGWQGSVETTPAIFDAINRVSQPAASGSHAVLQYCGRNSLTPRDCLSHIYLGSTGGQEESTIDSTISCFAQIVNY